MLMKEYRICMPLTVEEYRIGQLYMINKHSHEQSEGGDGVEVVMNEFDTHPKYGSGQVTEKRIYLSSKLPSWMKKFVPMIFYITEKAWNFYPYTITEYTCSFLPKLSIKIETHFENNNGSNDNVFEDKPTPKDSVCFLDILIDPIPEKYYKKDEDLSNWVSEKTGRGPLVDGWRNNKQPVMCSYKRVQCSFEVYGFQGRTEEFIHRNIRDILLVGHRQAVAWLDQWHGMSLAEVREFEKQLQQETNQKMKNDMSDPGCISKHKEKRIWGREMIKRDIDREMTRRVPKDKREECEKIDGEKRIYVCDDGGMKLEDREQYMTKRGACVGVLTLNSVLLNSPCIYTS